jgi:hypothetical protein
MTFATTPLIVEDGSVVAGANTFVSAVDAGQYLYDRGVMTQAQYDAADMAGILRRGIDALKNLPCLSAYALPLAQPIAIPKELIEAQIWVAYYIWMSASNDPANVSTTGSIKRERVDVIEREYTDSGPKKTSVTLEDMPNVANALRALGCASLTVKPLVLPAGVWV